MFKTVIASLSLMAAEAKLGFLACPEVKFMDNLDMDRYSGKWYTVKRDDAKNPMYMSRCDMKELHNNGDGSMWHHAASFAGEESGYKEFNATLIECGEHDNSTC